MKTLFITLTFVIGFGLTGIGQNNTITNKNSTAISAEKEAKLNSSVATDNNVHQINTDKSAVNTSTRPKKEKSNYNRKPELITDKKNIEVK
jgi:hypothetical protein